LILNAGWLKEYDPEGVLDLFLDERQKQKHFQNMTKEIDEFLNFFDNKNKTETIVAAKRAKLQDQDGWVTIDSRVGRRMGPEDFAMRLATRIDMDKVRETEKKRQLQGFYRKRKNGERDEGEGAKRLELQESTFRKLTYKIKQHYLPIL